MSDVASLYWPPSSLAHVHRHCWLDGWMDGWGTLCPSSPCCPCLFAYLNTRVWYGIHTRPHFVAPWFDGAEISIKHSRYPDSLMPVLEMGSEAGWWWRHGKNGDRTSSLSVSYVKMIHWHRVRYAIISRGMLGQPCRWSVSGYGYGGLCARAKANVVHDWEMNIRQELHSP